MKLSIRWALILGILGLIWGTQTIITSSTYISSQDVLVRHSLDIMTNIADLTMEQSEKHLSLAQGAAHLTKRLIGSNVVGGEPYRLDLLERYFLDQLVIYPHFAGIYLGSPTGDFYYVSRSDDRSPDGFRTKIIRRTQSRQKTTLIWRDKDLNKLSVETDPGDRYDPRTRPWYQKASDKKTIVWTDPYIFFTSQKPGITIAGPVFQDLGELQGVVGVDIEIDQLSEFISKLRIGKTGRAFMLNNNGDVVAFHDIHRIKVAIDEKNSGIRLVKIDEIDDDLSRAAYRAVEWTRSPDGRLFLESPRFARFMHQGRFYHAMFTPFQNRQWPWIIGVYLPENDYLGELKDNRYFNLLITIALSIAATVVGLYLAKGVIRPLAALERSALAIKNQNLKKTETIHSVFTEIQETAEAFNRMKEGLFSSEEKYRQIFDNIQDIYYETTFDGFILEISPSVERISKYRRDELIGKSIFDLYDDPSVHEPLAAKLLKDNRVENYELVLRNKDGSREHCSITSYLKKDANSIPLKIVGSLRVITNQKKAELQLRRYQDHLEELVWERTREWEKANKQLIEHIEDRKRQEAEQRKLEERVERIQRLEGIGTLAGGVAHDFNNLLMGIQGNISLILLETKHDEKLNAALYDKLKGIESCITAGSELTRQLLGFARGGKYLVKSVDFNTIVRNTARMFGRTRKEISVIEKLQPGLWSAMADQSQVEQVLLNIYINAWQAMPEGGHIYVETRNITLDETFTKPFDVHSGRYVRIAVTDTGMGMDRETQKRIFEPFFTTKEIGRGTGLGLASAYGIVKNHDGIIDFSSEPGQGTTFYIYLPATDSDLTPEPDQELALDKGNETILLVDDEEVIIKVNTPMLVELGYDVLVAHGGREAVNLFTRHFERIDLVILDLIMPDMGGVAVFEALKKIKPSIKVLLSSGYSLDGEAEAIMAGGCNGFIQKPFRLEQFSSAIRKILDQ